MALGAPTFSMPPAQSIYDPVPQHPPTDPMAMLQMRMRWGVWSLPLHQQGSYCLPHPFDFVTVADSKKDVIIFVIKDGEPVTLRDTHELFPSDTLVTQLRLLSE